MIDLSAQIFMEGVMMQHSQSTTNQQSQTSQSKVRNWLMSEGWQIGEEHAPDATWVLTTNDKRGRKLIIAQPHDRTDVIVIQAGVKTSDNVRRKIGEMDEHERRNFYFDLQYSLLQMGVEYSGAGDPFELIVVVQKMYSDAFIRDAFIQRVIQVRNAQVIVLLKIQSLMNESPTPPAAPLPIGFKGEKE